MAEAPAAFSGVLRRLRTGVQLTQGELARAANLSVRAVGDLERGIAATPHRDTVRLLADALHRVSGELAQAQECHQQALDLARATGSSWAEAHSLAGLGRCAMADGHPAQAGELLRQALEIFQRIGAPEAADLLAELAGGRSGRG